MDVFATGQTVARLIAWYIAFELGKLCLVTRFPLVLQEYIRAAANVFLDLLVRWCCRYTCRHDEGYV